MNQIQQIQSESPHLFVAQQGEQSEEGSLLSHVAFKQYGFTMVELITVMVIVGILAAAALPRFFDGDTFQQRGAADQIKSSLRYAQKVAIAQRRIVAVDIATAASSNCTATLTAGNVVCGVPAPVASVILYFNGLGQPVTAAGVVLAANTSITIGANIVTVEAETGYVH